MTDETPTGLTMRLIRNEIIEQCAKVAENCFGGKSQTYVSENSDYYRIQDQTSELIAARIRALAVHQTTPCPGCDGHECDDGCAYPGAVQTTPRDPL